MIKIFCGEDTFESYHRAFQEVLKLKKDVIDVVKIINADEITSVDTFLSNFESIDMFGGGNIIFAKRLFENRKLVDLLQTNFDRVDQYDIIIWENGKIDGRSKLYKDLKKKGRIFEFTSLKPWQINTWIKEFCLEKGIKLSEIQLNTLVESLGTDKWLLSRELEKIYLYLSAVGQTEIEDKMLFSILGFDARGNIWNFLDFVGNRDYKNAIKELEKIATYESSMQPLIALLAREFDLISKVIYSQRNNINTRDLGIHPFVLQKTKIKAQKFTFDKIKQLSTNLLRLDLSIKNGEIDDLLGMTIFLLGI